MADQDKEEKTEDPTPKRLREARQKGNVPTSQEVNSWLVLFSAAMFIAFLGPWMVVSLKDRLRFMITMNDEVLKSDEGLYDVLGHFFIDILPYFLVPALIFMFAGIIAVVGQVGFIFSAEQMKVDISKLSPMKGLEKILGSRAIVEFLKGLGKLAIVGVVTYIIVKPVVMKGYALVGEDISVYIPMLQELVIKLLIGVLAVLLIIAIADLMFQKYKHIEQLKMSKQEVKDERKQTEGDPKVKQRLAKLRQEKAMKRMMLNVPDADVVVTNPIHFAVAMKYDNATMDAPVVVAKGHDEVAQRIRKVAEENDVPIVENPPLARTLFAAVEIDQEIPEEHYKAVAEVISYIYSLNTRR